VRHSRAGHEVVMLGKSDLKEAVAVMRASFNGTATAAAEPAFHWAIGTKFRDAYDDKDRLDFFDFYMTWYFHVCLKFGILIGVRDATTQKLLGVAGIVAPGLHGVMDARDLFKSHMVALVLAVGRSPPDTRSSATFPGTTKRMDATSLTNLVALAEVCTGQEWYVVCMAVEPLAQGRGVARTALGAAAAVADASGKSIYLEADGPRNRALYESLGYVAVRSATICEDAAVCGENNPSPTVHFMMRKPSS
jgi:GNAT superfamily N-acetyltransferase